MKIKDGVEINGLKKGIIEILPLVNNIIEVSGNEMVITSALEGQHLQQSLHYRGLAIDIRLPYNDYTKDTWMASWLQLTLGRDYDVIYEKTHIHIEYDPD